MRDPLFVMLPLMVPLFIADPLLVRLPVIMLLLVIPGVFAEP